MDAHTVSVPTNTRERGHPMEINEITKNEAVQLRRDAARAKVASDKAVWAQALALHRIYYSGYACGENEIAPIYELWGYETWYDYVEKEVGIHVGRANMMVSVAHFFVVKMKDHWNKQVLTLTQMRAISVGKNVTPGNLNSWITKARNMTPCELDHQLTGRHGHHTKTVALKLPESDATLLREALDQLMATGEFSSRGEALMSVFKGRKAKVA